MTGSLARTRSVDHPRIRGEHSALTAQVGVDLGSSPHTRGARLSEEGVLHARGIIPAYAGSTTWIHWKTLIFGDHPRIRGEHYRPDGRRRDRGGSSPHTRGARPKFEVPRHGTQDHPRIRGEHYGHLSVLRNNVGSSPHTRGALDLLEILPFDDGIIPAYAGSTMCRP